MLRGRDEAGGAAAWRCHYYQRSYVYTCILLEKTNLSLNDAPGPGPSSSLRET